MECRNRMFVDMQNHSMVPTSCAIFKMFELGNLIIRSMAIDMKSQGTVRNRFARVANVGTIELIDLIA